MLSDKISADERLRSHGFLIGIEVQETVDIEGVMRAIGEALYTYKGVGEVDVQHLGEIEVINDPLEVPLDDIPELIGVKES